MLKTQTKTIAGYEVSVTQLPAMASFRLLTRLSKILTPAVGELLSLASGAEDVGSVDVSKLAPALAVLADRLNEEDAEHLVKEAILGRCSLVSDSNKHVDVTRAIFDETFCDIQDLLELLWFALTVNYGNFIDAVTSQAVAALAISKQRKNSEPSPSTSK